MARLYSTIHNEYVYIQKQSEAICFIEIKEITDNVYLMQICWQKGMKEPIQQFYSTLQEADAAGKAYAKENSYLKI